nr:phage regulatory CII family protein [uncultured Moraxella sp.]
MSSFTQSQRATKCVLPLKQAVYQACKAKRGVLGEIAEIYGINYNTLALQINPNRDCHTLTPETIELVLEHTKDTRILDAICHAHGGVAWFELPNGDNGEMISDIAELGQKFVDMNKTTLEAIADNTITVDEYKAMQKVGFALIAQIQKILITAKENIGVTHG